MTSPRSRHTRANGAVRTGASMRNRRDGNSSLATKSVLLALAFTLTLTGGAALPQSTPLQELVSAVVRIKTYINPIGRTVEILGREREGSGIIIDESGLILTTGYLMVEAHAAEVRTEA